MGSDIEQRRAEVNKYGDIANKLNAHLGENANAIEKIMLKMGLKLVDFTLYDGTYDDYIAFWNESGNRGGYGIILTFSSLWHGERQSEQVLVMVDFASTEVFNRRYNRMIDKKYSHLLGDSAKVSDDKTQYTYEGKPITHTKFISLMRNAGIGSGYKELHYDHLLKLAKEGNQKAKDLLSKITVSDTQKVDDMVKPAYLRGYAEKYRNNRRKKGEDTENENIEETNQKQNVNDSQRLQDDSLDDFNPGSAVRGIFNDEGYLHIYANTNLTRKEFISAIEPALADVTIDYFYEGKRFKTWSESTYFYVTLPNMKEAVAPFIDAIKGKIYCIHFKVDNNPTGKATIWSPQTSWNANASTEELMAKMQISDSKKIKDEQAVPLDGVLMIAFKDGQEEEGYNAVKEHSSEQGEISGAQYETYDVDNQNGVAIIDLCAATKDANAFVKALLKEWGLLDKVADLKFVASDLMENAQEEVTDSYRIKDSKELDLNVIYEMNDDDFADFIDEIFTILEWYYGEDMPEMVDDLLNTPKIITRDEIADLLSALGYDEFDNILRAYGANNSYDSIIDELFL